MCLLRRPATPRQVPSCSERVFHYSLYSSYLTRRHSLSWFKLGMIGMDQQVSELSLHRRWLRHETRMWEAWEGMAAPHVPTLSCSSLALRSCLSPEAKRLVDACEPLESKSAFKALRSGNAAPDVRHRAPVASWSRTLAHARRSSDCHG